MTHHPDIFLSDLLARMDLSPEDAEQSLRNCLRVPLAHGVRVEVLRGASDLVRAQNPHKVSRFLEFLRLFPALDDSTARYLPVVDLHLMMIQAARLIFPDRPLQEAMLEHSHLGSHVFFDNPLFGIVTRAVSNDLASCLENLVQGAPKHLFNYGNRELERLSARNYRFIFSDDHPFIFRDRTPPFLQNLIHRFQRRGEVLFESSDDQEYVITMRWD